MNSPAIQYFALIVPTGVVLFGLALLACWSVMRQQRFLPWLAAGYILPALAMGAQSLMGNEQLATWSVAAGALYLSGTWALARGMAMRYGGNARPMFALCVSVLALGLLYYYSMVDRQLWMRAFWLNTALAALYMLPMAGILRSLFAADWLERLVSGSYTVLAIYALVRPVLLLTLIPISEMEGLTRSGYWLLLLSGSLLLSLWFMLVLLACTLRGVLMTLREERNQDPLTRLMNRRAFFESAERALGDAQQAPWVVLVCDVDHFKKVNDEWGHDVGDQVLQELARVLMMQVRQGDLVARFGGEEFVILLGRTDVDIASGVAERIRQQLARTKFEAMTQHVTTSFGVAELAGPADLDGAIRRADGALYDAKQHGRNRVCVASKGLQITDVSL